MALNERDSLVRLGSGFVVLNRLLERKSALDVEEEDFLFASVAICVLVSECRDPVLEFITEVE
ncbi:hypothetical protein [Natronococcus sp. A-GB7]|uniref:hypothetical protein n=1 Tax=Natronococcus sp. A-GB7 TaxID=3037649 RepID=UPI00241E93F4|nr:hypothetical protein [Natronococcus sp. A-GB7]MDG5821706.1 hypothetical protein [Natronococcus sp. A-GB7]